MNNENPLGQKTKYIDNYNPDLLFPIKRKIKRDEINIDEDNLPFKGYDIWNAYEMSWLNEKGKPIVALARFIIPSNTKNIIESKSFKLYLNSFNGTRFKNAENIIKILKNDLTNALEIFDEDVKVDLVTLNELAESFEKSTKIEQVEQVKQLQQNINLKNYNTIVNYQGSTCLDDLDVEVKSYNVDKGLLKLEEINAKDLDKKELNKDQELLSDEVEEDLYSNLLKSNCLVTNQPDWGSVRIKYKGKKINHESILKYIISFRNHNEFHEQCVERIFKDISDTCRPSKLTVFANYTRRGGLDINPLRTNYDEGIEVGFQRLIRQ